MSLPLKEIIKIGTTQLSDAGVPDPEYDARALYMFQANLDRTGLMMHWQDILQDNQCERYFELIERRAGREPLQYITGTQAFMEYTFKVDPSVLIPRQDTETVVETALDLIRENPGSVLDLCTGSGAIGISIAGMVPRCRVTCSDISPEALKVAKENADINGIRGVKFVQSDMFEAFYGKLGNRKFDYIVSNPPYIRTDVIGTLEPEVKEHEPETALDGGETGLDFYMIIAEKAPEFLKKGGRLILEIGYDQGEAVSGLLGETGRLENIEIHKDLAGNNRSVTAVLRDLK